MFHEASRQLLGPFESSETCGVHSFVHGLHVSTLSPRLRQHVSRSPVARRQANALPTTQIPMAMRRRERNFATRSVPTHDQQTYHMIPLNMPARQQHAAFTPACFALACGTAPRKRTFHQGCASPQGTGQASSHASSLQNERFVRDFLQQSHVKSPKRAFRTTSSKTHMSKSAKRAFRRDVLQKSRGNTHRSTHITHPCQAVLGLQPLQTTYAHTPIPMSLRHSPPP